MHKGVFNADKHGLNILILGESHHISTDPNVTTDKIAGVPATYTTASVVLEHLEKLKNEKKGMHPFLTKIAQTFGAEDEETFWRSVYFGNYIDVLCGIGNSVAKNQIEEDGNRVKYNNQLFQFVNEHTIDKIFCFSVLAYKNLTDLADGEESQCETIGMRGKKRVYLRQCKYEAKTQRSGTSVILEKDLHVFGISHPQAKGGYSPEMYANALKSQIEF